MLNVTVEYQRGRNGVYAIITASEGEPFDLYEDGMYHGVTVDADCGKGTNTVITQSFNYYKELDQYIEEQVVTCLTEWYHHTLGNYPKEKRIISIPSMEEKDKKEKKEEKTQAYVKF